jgi:hypothetical protein
VQILGQRQGKTTYPEPTTLVQYKQQENPLLLTHNYTPLVISKNDKNKHIALLSQRKLALTGRNV